MSQSEILYLDDEDYDFVVQYLRSATPTPEEDARYKRLLSGEALNADQRQ